MSEDRHDAHVQEYRRKRYEDSCASHVVAWRRAMWHEPWLYGVCFAAPTAARITADADHRHHVDEWRSEMRWRSKCERVDSKRSAAETQQRRAEAQVRRATRRAEKRLADERAGIERRRREVARKESYREVLGLVLSERQAPMNTHHLYRWLRPQFFPLTSDLESLPDW